MIMHLCERFSCTPSQLDDEDADILHLVHLYDLAHPPEKTPTH